MILALLVFQIWTTWRDRKLAAASAVLSISLIAFGLVAGFCWNNYWQYYGQVLADGGSVSQFDMKAFEWIKRNTLKTDVILNVPEHDWGGLWIPAICRRRILNPHSSPFYTDEITEGNRNAIATYAFIGSKPLRSDRLDPTVEAIRHGPQWQKVASFGRAEVYGRRLMGPGAPAPAAVGPGARH